MRPHFLKPGSLVQVGQNVWRVLVDGPETLKDSPKEPFEYVCKISQFKDA